LVMRFRLLITLILLVVILIPTVALATEYSAGSNGTLYAQVVYGNGTPCNSATVTANLRASNGTKILDEVSMTYVTGSDGYYKYGFTVPSDIGAYTAEYKAIYPGGYIGYSGETINIVSFGGANITQENIDDIAEGVTNSTISGFGDTDTLGGALNNLFENYGGENMLLLVMVGIILFFMTMAYRTKTLHWSIAAAASWWGLTVWLYFSGADFFSLTDTYVQIFTVVFVLVSFIPLIDFMYHSNKVEIRRSVGGKTWTELGVAPKGTARSNEAYWAYKEKMHKMLGGRR